MTKRSTPSSTPNPASARGTPASGWPTPEPGDVLSYAYLWAREAEAGQTEGLKDRPAVVVLAQQQMKTGLRLIVAPVTHTPPDRDGHAVELPKAVKRDLRLDGERSWIVVDEVNSFVWPGPNVRPIDGGDPAYGAIPDWLLKDVQAAIGALAGRGGMRVTRRTDERAKRSIFWLCLCKLPATTMSAKV